MSNLRGDMSMDAQVQDRTDSMRDRRNNTRNAILQMRRQAQLEANNPTLEEYIREHNIDEDDVAGIVNRKDHIYTKNAENYIRDPILLKFRTMCEQRGLLTRSSIINFIKRVKKSIPQEALLDDESEEEVLEPLNRPVNNVEDEIPDYIPPQIEQQNHNENIQQQLAQNLNQNNNFNFIPNKMEQRDPKDIAKEIRKQRALERAGTMSTEQLREAYAKQAASGKIKLQGGNPKIPFAAKDQTGAWKLKPLDEDRWNDIKKDSSNAWINAFGKAHDFSYNPKMLDPQYAAWHGVKYGTDIYSADVNHDGYTDIIEVDEDDKIRTFNGYKIGPSKQKLYQEYYAAHPAVGNDKGKPVYSVKFDDWYQQRVKSFGTDEKGAAERKQLNTDLAKKGMYGYKVKETSINEHLKNYVKTSRGDNEKESIYDSVAKYIASQLVTVNVNQEDNKPDAKSKLVKGKFPITSFVGQIIRAYLFKHFNVAPSGNKDKDAEDINKLSRLANSRKTKDANKPYVKDAIINDLKAIFSNVNVKVLALNIFKFLVIEEDYAGCQTYLTQNIPLNQQIANACVALLQYNTAASRKRAAAMEADRAWKTNPMAIYNA